MLKMVFEVDLFGIKIKASKMSLTLQTGQVAAVRADAGLTATQVSTATLSGLAFSGNDDAVFTVSPDPNNPDGCLTTGVSAGSGTLSATGTAKETSGVTESLAGTLTIVVTAPAVPVATTIILTPGTPVAIGQTPPPAPPPL